jgi:hypothetical protein
VKQPPSHTEAYWTEHFESLLKPLIQDSTKILVERSEAMRTGLLQDIIRNLIYSKVVVADITDFNANVLWELGVRQSFTDGTVIIAEESVQSRIPFDLSIKGMLFYPNLGSIDYEKKLGDFKLKLILSIQDCLTHPDTPDSYVLETINGRSSIYQIIVHDEALRKLSALISEMESNLKLLNQCYEALQKNNSVEDGDPYSCISGRLRAHCVELLITSRYLAQNDQFYSDFETYIEGTYRINVELDFWRKDRHNTEFWLRENSTHLNPNS